MVWLNLKFNFKIVIISIQKSFLLLILIPFLSDLFHSYSNSISNSFPFLLSISVKKIISISISISISINGNITDSQPKGPRVHVGLVGGWLALVYRGLCPRVQSL